MPQNKPRIGILLALGESEGNKFELVSETRRKPARPWLKKTPSDFFIDRPDCKNPKTKQIIPGVVGIPGDVSIAEYIKYKYGDAFEIDYIEPKDITVERLKSNDINFTLIYDLLEAFHTDPSGKVFRKFDDALRRVDNVYPNVEYQEFINSKLLYYNYFKEMNIPIAPTITITKQEWTNRVAKLSTAGGPSAVAREVFEEVQRHGYTKFIAKPVYGQEAKGCEFFTTAELKMGEFTRYLTKIFKKYPGLIIQELIQDFGDTKASPELRMYFVGRQYQFTAMATKTKTYTLKEDGVGGTLNLPPMIDIRAMKALAFRAIDCMPRITMKRGSQNVELPRLLTRVDMGCIRDGVFKPWINEVEFVPSLYIEDHRCPLDALLGDQMVHITKQLMNKSARRSMGDSPLPRSKAGSSALSSPTKTPLQRRRRILSSPSTITPSGKSRRAPKLSLASSPLSVQWPIRRQKAASSPPAKASRRVLKVATKRSGRS